MAKGNQLEVWCDGQGLAFLERFKGRTVWVYGKILLK